MTASRDLRSRLLAREGHDAAIMIAIHLPAEEENAPPAPDRLYNRADHAFVAAFGKIRDTFNHAVRS